MAIAVQGGGTAYNVCSVPIWNASGSNSIITSEFIRKHGEEAFEEGVFKTRHGHMYHPEDYPDELPPGYEHRPDREHRPFPAGTVMGPEWSSYVPSQ